MADRQTLSGLKQTYEHIARTNDYYDWLGLDPEWIDDGAVRISMPAGEKHTTPSPPAAETLHGGIIATLIDLAGITALYAAKGELVGIATSELSVSYHDSIDEPVHADARVVEIGETLGTARAEIHPQGAPDTTVASGHTTCRFFDGNDD